MAYTRVERSSKSPSPPSARRSRSRSLPRTKDRGRSRSRSPVASNNPGNNLYVTGLSTRVTDADLKKHFNREGKVVECHLVIDPRSRESRGFAFVTMETAKDADRCIKYLNRSVLEGRLMTVERAKRSRERTPTPGAYCGSRSKDRERVRTPPRVRSPPRSSSRRHERSRSPRSSRRRRSYSPAKSKDSHRRHKD